MHSQFDTKTLWSQRGAEGGGGVREVGEGSAGEGEGGGGGGRGRRWGGGGGGVGKIRESGFLI
jgi:hypothetical protein